MNPCGTCHWWKGPRMPKKDQALESPVRLADGNTIYRDVGECHGGVPVGGRNEFRWPTTRRDDGCRGWEPVKT